MKKLLKDRTGSASIIFFGFLFLLLLMTFLIIEMGATMENHDYAVSVLQRACNSAVEANIMDEYRADRVLMLDARGADEDFRSFVQNDLPSKYRVVINTVSCTASPPSMTATGTMTFPTIFSQYGFEEITVTFKVKSTNYDLDQEDIMELTYTLINAGILAYGGVMDYKKREIPDLVPVTLMLTGFLNGTLILPRIICLLITAAALLISAKLSKNSLPGGDFKLICALTFSSGLCSMATILLLTGLCAILLSIIRKQPIRRNIPLCTYVAPAYLITGAAQLILQGGLL